MTLSTASGDFDKYGDCFIIRWQLSLSPSSPLSRPLHTASALRLRHHEEVIWEGEAKDGKGGPIAKGERGRGRCKS
jgi:hypothetical protein